MRKLLICFAVLLSYGIGFVDQCAGGCNCQSSSAEQDSQEKNNTTKVINNSSQTNQSEKSTKKRKEEELFKKELQELEEFLKQSKKENSGNLK